MYILLSKARGFALLDAVPTLCWHGTSTNAGGNGIEGQAEGGARAATTDMIDSERVTAAILSVAEQQKLSPLAATSGAALVEAWVEQWAERDNAMFNVDEVESVFAVWIDTGTLLVGVRDVVGSDADGPLSCEWKSTKEPQKNKDGSDSAWWNEDTWLDSLLNGVQLPCYAVAACSENPRIMVRAILKSTPPQFWPSKGSGIYQFPNELVTLTRSVLVVRAAAIRAARKTQNVPWALPGLHCTNKYRRVCPYYETVCKPHTNPPAQARAGFDKDDPGYAGIKKAGLDPDELPLELVIFSASSLDTSQQCLERYRLLTSCFYKKDSDYELQVGTALHAGLANVYQQIRE